MKSAIYPGTFDPPTLGHLDIIQRASRNFNKLIVAIGKNNSKKSTFFSIQERVFFLKSITNNIPNIEIEAFPGLLVDFSKDREIDIVIRSIRTVLDFEYETLQAQMNRRLGNLETFYLVVNEKYRLISSTAVKELASHGKRLKEFIPEGIEEAVFQRLFQANG